MLQTVSSLTNVLKSFATSSSNSANDVFSAANNSINSIAGAQAAIQSEVWGNTTAGTTETHSFFGPDNSNLTLSTEAINTLKQTSHQIEALTSSIAGSMLSRSVIGMLKGICTT